MIDTLKIKMNRLAKWVDIISMRFNIETQKVIH